MAPRHRSPRHHRRTPPLLMVMLVLGCLAGRASAGPSALEERILKKQAALEAKLSAAKDAKKEKEATQARAATAAAAAAGSTAPVPEEEEVVVATPSNQDASATVGEVTAEGAGAEAGSSSSDDDDGNTTTTTTTAAAAAATAAASAAASEGMEGASGAAAAAATTTTPTTTAATATTATEERFLKKQAALEAKLAKAKEAKKEKEAAAKAKAEAEAEAAPPPPDVPALSTGSIGEAEGDVLFSEEIRDENGTVWGTYTLPSAAALVTGQQKVHPADHVLEYAIALGLPPPLRRQLSKRVCEALGEAHCGSKKRRRGGASANKWRDRAVVARLPVNAGGEVGIIGRIDLLDGEEAVDAAYRFAARKGLDSDAFKAIKSALCQRDSRPGVIACGREEAVVYHEQASPHAPLLEPLSTDNGGDAGGGDGGGQEGDAEASNETSSSSSSSFPSLDLPEDLYVKAGEEAAEVIYQLLVVKHQRPMEHYRRLADRVCAMNATTPHFRCSRTRIIEQVQSIDLGGDAKTQVEVLDEEEPVDSIFRFATKWQIDAPQRHQMLQVICGRRGDLGLAPCKRDLAIVLKGHSVPHPLPKGEGGGMDLPGRLVVWENEEVADVVYQWWMGLLGPSPAWYTQHHPAVGEQFRDDLVNKICDGYLSRPSQYDPTLANELLGPNYRSERPESNNDHDDRGEYDDGKYDSDSDDGDDGDDGDDDKDAMLGRPSPPLAERWTRRDFGVAPFCRRREAVILQIPLSDENQRSLGVFTLMTGEEPADTVFAFGARNGLHPGFRENLLNVVCDTVRDAHKVARHCKRRRAMAFNRKVQAHAGFTVTDNVTGEVTPHGNYPKNLEIWEDEEPADAVYRFAVEYGIPVEHRQNLIFNLCTTPDYGLGCSRAIPAVFTLDINGEDQQPKGRLAVIEGQRPADSLLLFMNQVSGTFKMAQVFKHPNLRRRLFHRLCGAAADAGRPLDCSVTVPRKRAVAVELVYNGLKVSLEYFFPDKGRYSPGEGKALPECVPLRPDQLALDDVAEAEVARYGYDQSMVDHERRVWLTESLGIERARSAADTLGLSHKRRRAAPRNSSSGGGGGENDEEEEEEEEEDEQALRTEAVSGCLAPTRAAVSFFCRRLQPPPNNCEKDIHAALMQHLIKDDDARWIKAGPVGVDYYQMMRCPNDARLEEVQVRMAANRIEVERLLDNVTGRVLKAAMHGREGLVSFAETNASIAAANASLQAARSLLTAAAAGVAAARGALRASEHNGEAAETALEAARTVQESLRNRLLLVCNDTIAKRNCSRSSVLVPLPSLGEEGTAAAPNRLRQEAMRLERAMAYNGSYLSLDAAGRREADGLEPLDADAEQRRRRSWRDRMEEKEVARLTALGYNVTNTTSVEEEEEKQRATEHEKGKRAGSIGDRWESIQPTGVPTRVHQMNLDAMMRRQNEIMQGTAAHRRSGSPNNRRHRHDDDHNFGRGKKPAVTKTDKEYYELLDKIDDNKRRNRDLLGTNATDNATAAANNSSNSTTTTIDDEEEEEEEDAVEQYLKELVKDPNRLVPKETWRICLEKQTVIGRKSSNGDGGSSVMAIGGGNGTTTMVQQQHAPKNDTDRLVVPELDVAEVSISVADMFGLVTDEEGALAVLEEGEKQRRGSDNDDGNNDNNNDNNDNGAQVPSGGLVSDAEWHADAVVGCEILARNESWVCPAARDKLPGLLPRFPVQEPLKAGQLLLDALATALSQVREGLQATMATLGAAQELIEAGRVNRAVGKAALTVARLNLNAANKTANGLGKLDNGQGGDDSMEKVKHRSWALKQAAFDLTEDKNREFYDKPCKPVFGACCARDQADGGMNIICDGGN